MNDYLGPNGEMNKSYSISARALAEILEMTEDMLEQGRNNHWEEVTRLE